MTTRHQARSLRRGSVVVALLLATSCGSSSSDTDDGATSGAPNSDSTEEVTTVAEADDSEQAAASDEAAASAGGTGLGMIEIGDVRHELTITRCLQMFGAIGGDGVSVSEPDNVSITFEFSPEDWNERDESEGWSENGTVRLDSDDPYRQWESGQSLLELYNLPDGVELSELDITSYDISDDGQSVTGEATFIELTSVMTGTEPGPIPGTFSFSCPPEG